MGLSNSQSHAHRFFLLANYIVIGAATSCIFLALSLRLLPSAVGVLVILLHVLTIAIAIAACSSTTSDSSARCHASHMAATVIAAIFQGAVALMVFSETADFLRKMKSYVHEEDGVVILRMVAALGTVVFVMEWVVLVLAFVMRFYVYVEDAKVQQEHEERVRRKDWLPFQVV